MVKGNNYFDRLILFDGVELSPPLFEKNEMKVKANNFTISKTHPLNKSEKELIVSEASLIFKGVRKSIRTIYEYENQTDQDTTNTSYKIVDFISSDNAEENQKFGMEGVLTEPYAYVDWEIEADEFILVIHKI